MKYTDQQLEKAIEERKQIDSLYLSKDQRIRLDNRERDGQIKSYTGNSGRAHYYS